MALDDRSPAARLLCLGHGTIRAREPAAALRRDRRQREPLRLRGAVNGVWLAGVVLAVAFLAAPSGKA